MKQLTEQKSDKTLPKQERVSLDEASAAKLDLWLEQVLQKVPGIKIGRSELVRWLVNSHSESLSDDELLQVKSSYFDEMEFALWMVRQLKESRARGERLSISELIEGAQVGRSAKRTRRKTNTTEASGEEVALE